MGSVRRASGRGGGGPTQPDGFSRARINTVDHTMSEDYGMCTGEVSIHFFPV